MVGRNILEHPSARDYLFLSPSSKELDLTDRFQVRNYLTSNKPDLIIHAAAKVGGIQANIKNPVAFLDQNLEINRAVIGEAMAAGIPKLINFGSSCMYPRNALNPLMEESMLSGELEPTNEGYALSKIVAERLCRYICQEHPALNYKTIVPCNLYGRFDSFDPSRSHLVPAIISKTDLAFRNGLRKIDIWGDGTARREFMYSADIADFLFYYIRNFESAPVLMNVGLGRDYAINEYYEAAAKVVGYDGEFVHDLSKPVGMKQKLVSIDKLTQFGWKPKTTLLEGLTATYRFYKESEQK